MLVPIEDIEALKKYLKNDYIIKNEMSALVGGLALKYGRLLALANAALITTKHLIKTLSHILHPVYALYHRCNKKGICLKVMMSQSSLLKNRSLRE